MACNSNSPRRDRWTLVTACCARATADSNHRLILTLALALALALDFGRYKPRAPFADQTGKEHSVSSNPSPLKSCIKQRGSTHSIGHSKSGDAPEPANPQAASEIPESTDDSLSKYHTFDRLRTPFPVRNMQQEKRLTGSQPAIGAYH